MSVLAVFGYQCKGYVAERGAAVGSVHSPQERRHTLGRAHRRLRPPRKERPGRSPAAALMKDLLAIYSAMRFVKQQNA